MGIDKELVDKLLAGYEKPEDIIGENGLLKQLTKALVERALWAELTTHLGYEKHSPEGHNSGNSRKGVSGKRLKGDFGTVEIEVPRDRQASFEPKLIAKGQTRFAGFDEKILSLYARGMTTREIQGHLEEIYQVEVSPTLISNVTEAVMDEVKAWQSRPLDAIYPIVYLDALVVKMRTDGRVENRAVYVAMGVTVSGQKEVLGLWSSANEGAKFWLQVLTELQNRGLKDIFIACVDGLKGFPQAIETVYPKDDGSALHRAHGAGQSELRELEGAQASGPGSEDDLLRRHGRAGRAATGGFCRSMGPAIPHDQRLVAEKLAGRDSVFPVSAGDPQDRLYHQRHRITEHEFAQGDQGARTVSF
jgi:Transposase, Mutator family